MIRILPTQMKQECLIPLSYGTESSNGMERSRETPTQALEEDNFRSLKEDGSWQIQTEASSDEITVIIANLVDYYNVIISYATN